MSDKNFESLKFEPLHEDNLKAVHEMCNKNVQFLNHSFQTFKTTTIESKSFDPELSIVASDLEGKIIAFFMVVFRRSQIFRKKRKVAVLKFFVVSEEWRYKGLGARIYLELYKRIRDSENRCFRMKYEVMSSVPDYWLPGLDPRHTEAFFFLEKQGFKTDYVPVDEYGVVDIDIYYVQEVIGSKIFKPSQEQLLFLQEVAESLRAN